MASENDETAAEVPVSECGVCRGTGEVISNAGGEPHPLVCPWCEGSKKSIADHDAQEHPAEQYVPRQPTAEELAAPAKRPRRKATPKAKADASKAKTTKK